MKTHHLWLERLQSIGCRGAERGARTSARARARINSELPEVRRQILAPCRFSRSLARGRRVAKEIDIVRLVTRRSNGLQFRTHAIRREHCTGQRAQAAGIGYGNSQFAALRARHGRLNDGQPNPEQFLQRHRIPPIVHCNGRLTLSPRKDFQLTKTTRYFEMWRDLRRAAYELTTVRRHSG